MRLALVSLALVFAVSTTPAQVPPESERIADELADIHLTLKRLVQLLEAAEARNDADLLLRRIDLMERRIAPLQGRVDSTQSEAHGLENEIRRMRAFEQELEDSIDEAVRDGSDTPENEQRELQSQIRSELKQLLEQLEVAELRKRQAEDDLADAREEIEVLDETLLELLNAR
jgi:chromosome segregation ATPase